MHGIHRNLAFHAVAGALLVTQWGCGEPPAPQIGPEPLPSEEGELGAGYDAGTRELVLELGPVDLPANADHHGVQQPEPREAAVPADGWVNGYRVELLDKNGQPVPHSVMHHVNIIVPGRRELFSQIMQRLGAAGSETGPIRTPRLLGYPLTSADRILLTAMLHNPTATAYEGVRVRVRFPHVAKSAFVRPLRVYPFYLDVMPPAGIHEYDLPAGKSEKSWEGEPAVSGRILGMSGHVHKYATSLRLENVTEGRLLYEAKPLMDEAGNVTGMPQDMFVWKLGLPIVAGHVYRLTVAYDNPTGEMIPGGGMGALGGIMLAKRGEEWPAIDPRHEEYMRDLEVTWRRDGSHAAKKEGATAAGHAHH